MIKSFHDKFSNYTDDVALWLLIKLRKTTLCLLICNSKYVPMLTAVVLTEFTKKSNTKSSNELMETETRDFRTRVKMYLGATDADERCETAAEGALHSHV